MRRQYTYIIGYTLSGRLAAHREGYEASTAEKHNAEKLWGHRERVRAGSVAEARRRFFREEDGKP